MVESTTAPGRIFISYRREETAYPAGWLFDRLVDHFGEGQVFKDIDSIEPGDDFVDVLNRAVGSCNVLLALIGTEWLTVTNEDGSRRIDNPADFVRLEIETALARNVRVVPVLVGGAQMPQAEDLPLSLATLARRQALELSPGHFAFETSRLFQMLEETLGVPPSKPPTSRSEPEKHTPSASPAHVRRSGHPSPARSTTSRIGPRRPLSRHARILAGAGVAIAAAVLVPLLLVALGSGSGSSAKAAVFQDDFSGRTSGWDDAGEKHNGGHYANGKYRVYSRRAADHFGDAAFPRSATSVFPMAPRNVSVAAVARRLLGGDQDAGYGLACRADPTGPSYYQFAIWRDHVAIEKVTPTAYKELRSEGLATVNRNGANRLQATCSTDESGAARLVFSVNGKVVVQATDDHPLSTGTVGLVAATDYPAKAIEAEFDDFVVRPA